MSVNKIVTKVDGIINRTIDFNDLKSGLAEGSHTITLEAFNGSTLVSTQTRNFTISATTTSYEAETTSYIDRVNVDSGLVINGDYIDTVFKQLKADTSLANLLFWMDAKGGTKKDASNFISKTYDLSTSLNDTTQVTGSKQPVLNTNIVFDGTDDSLNFSEFTLTMGTTLYVRFTPQLFKNMLLGFSGNTNVYLYLATSTEIRLKGSSTVYSWNVPTMVAGATYDLFIQRTLAGYTLFLDAANRGEKASSEETKFNLIGNYAAAGFDYNGSIERLALFNEVLTTSKMNNLIAL